MKYIFNQYTLLVLIIILSFLVRLYKINSPIADWHSWRQADTAAVTRNFIKEGFNPLLPRYDDMSGVSQNPIPNPGRFRFVEFPIYNIFVYPFYLLFSINDIYSRLVSIIFSLGSVVFIFLITKRYTDAFTGLVAAFIFGLLPFNVFFSRTTLPEPTFVFFSLGMIYFVDQWIIRFSKKNLVLSYIFTTTAFLIKPWAIFFALPLFYLVYRKEQKVFPINKKYIYFALAALLPFILWRLWIMQHPEGIPASDWLMNGDDIRFRPAFWWWIVSERMGREILGVTGFFLFFLGLICKPKSNNFFLSFWALSAFLFMAIFATGNVRHNYYQISFIPIAAIFTAVGFVTLLRGFYGFVPRFFTIILALIFLPLTFYFSWNLVKTFYPINNPSIIEAGKKADQVLSKEAIVLAPYNGDTAFLYQTNRAGWAFEALPITQMVTQYGVTNYVSVNHDKKTDWVVNHFKVLENNPNFVIADLTKVEKLFDKDPEPN